MFAAFRWRKAVLFTLLSAIFLLNFLPWLGWTWHRVLPEHDHVFLGRVSQHEDEELAPPAIEAAQVCTDCLETRIESGVVHLPAGIALQLLALAMSLSTVFILTFDFSLTSRVSEPTLLYLPPCLAPADPPPTCP